MIKSTQQLIFLIIISIGFSFESCAPSQKKTEKKRIFYVNSYHEGYGSSDEVMAGIAETLNGENVELKTFFMDTKRKSSTEEIKQSVSQALKKIDEYAPDLLIVSDDNAVKYVVEPFFSDSKLPIVFCGVNWSADQYHLGENSTGMLEVLPLRECISVVLDNYSDAKKMVVLSENSLSEQNNKTLLDTLYQNLGLEVQYSLADDFENWQNMFLQANQNADFIYMPTNGAIKNWDDEKAKQFVSENLKIPAITCDDFMMPFAVFGLTKVAKEQGEWAAKTALNILNGQKPSDIPYTKNSQSKAWLNVSNAEKINFRINEQEKEKCTQL